MTQTTIFDLPTTHAQNLRRVKTNIAPTILRFLTARGIDGHFTGAQLTAYVTARHDVAPASADRILRDLKQRGKIGYELVSRAASLYKVTALPESEVNEVVA